MERFRPRTERMQIRIANQPQNRWGGGCSRDVCVALFATDIRLCSNELEAHIMNVDVISTFIMCASALANVHCIHQTDIPFRE